MSLQKRLTKHGNSYALIIDKNILELLGIDVAKPVELSIPDGATLTIRQPASMQHRAQLEEATEQLYSEYGKVMKRLAE